MASHILDLIVAACNPLTRASAEEELTKLVGYPNYALYLSQILASSHIEQFIRQFAGILLKRHIKHHWDCVSDEFIEPVCSDAEKETIKQLLPSLLCDASSKIKTAVCMIIQQISSFDYPDKWPLLLKQIVDLFSNVNALDGATKTLLFIVEDISSDHLTLVVPHLFPLFLSVIQSNNNAIIITARCIAIYRNLLTSILSLDEATRHLLIAPSLNDYVSTLMSIITAQTSSDSEAFSSKIESIKTFNVLISEFSHLWSVFSHVLPHIWNYLVSYVPIYVQQFIDAECVPDDFYDDDGDIISLEVFLERSIAFFRIVVISANEKIAFSIIKEGMLFSLIDCIICLMQITPDSIDLWNTDPNEFAAAEDDESAVDRLRPSCKYLLSCLLEVFQDTAISSLVQSISQIFNQSTSWKYHEAAILAFGLLGNHYNQAPEEDDEDQPPTCPQFAIDLLQQFVFPELNSEIPFLRGRSIWCVANFTEILNQEGLLKALNSISLGLASSSPIPVRLMSLTALSKLVYTSSDDLSPFLSTFINNITEMLLVSNEDTLHMALECLSTVLERVPSIECANSEPRITPVLFHCWSVNFSDRLVTECVIDVIEVFIKNPTCGPVFQSRLLSLIVPLISKFETLQYGIVDSCFDLMASAVARGINDSFISSFFPIFLNIMSNSTDHSILESGCKLLAILIRVSAPGFVSLLDSILLILQRLLDPCWPDSAILSIGKLVSNMIIYLSDHVNQQVMASILKVVIHRLVSASLPSFQQGLILIIARLIIFYGEPVLHFLQEMQPVFIDGSPVNALAFVLRMWSDNQPDFPGSYEAKVAYSALFRLIYFDIEQVNNLPAKGYPIVQETNSNQPRRGRSAGNPCVSFSSIPLGARLLSLMANEWKSEDNEEEAAYSDDEEIVGMMEEFQYLSDLLFQDAETLDDDALADPLNQIDLSLAISQFIQEFSNNRRNTFLGFFKHLNQEDQIIIQNIMSS